jgi:hypothetical protein
MTLYQQQYLITDMFVIARTGQIVNFTSKLASQNIEVSYFT